MLFMDDDDIENIKDNPGYQPKQKESLLEIVIKSVRLMRLLKQNRKLVDSEVEETEDLIKDIRAEGIQQKWIKESTGKTGGTDPEKEDKVIDESPREKRDVQSPETPHGIPSPGTPKVTVENTTPMPVTPPDFLDESPPKIKLSPILEMLADDNAKKEPEKEGTVKGKGNEGQNMDVEKKNGVKNENVCTENDKSVNKTEENKTEVNSDKDKNQSPVKEDNESEGSITTGIRDVLIGGADGDVIDADEEEEDRQRML